MSTENTNKTEPAQPSNDEEIKIKIKMTANSSVHEINIKKSLIAIVFSV